MCSGAGRPPCRNFSGVQSEEFVSDLCKSFAAFVAKERERESLNFRSRKSDWAKDFSKKNRQTSERLLNVLSFSATSTALRSKNDFDFSICLHILLIKCLESVSKFFDFFFFNFSKRKPATLYGYRSACDRFMLENCKCASNALRRLY